MKAYKADELCELNEGLDYSDVFIIPQYSEVQSRSQVDTSVKIGDLTLRVPIISANMSSVSEHRMCITLWKLGAIGALHRFMSIEQNIEEYKKIKEQECECFVSVGVKEEDKQRTRELYSVGARYFVIDIAHGDSILMKNKIEWLKKSFKDVFVVAGNVATPDACKRLKYWGADAIKLNIGPGSVCSTKDITGCTLPAFQTILNCANAVDIPLISDGGFNSIGDFAKSLGASADLCMTGKLFSGSDECPGLITNGKKEYYGMASKTAMKLIRKDDETLPTPEGKSILVDSKGSVKDIIKDIQGGLRSSFSYCNAKNLTEFQKNVRFGVRRTVKQ